MDQDWFGTVQLRILSHWKRSLIILHHSEKEKPPLVGGLSFLTNYLDSATQVTCGLVKGSDWLGRCGHRKGMKPSRSLKSSPPRFIATPGDLTFQEGRPLPPSDDEDKGQTVRSAKRFAPNREVLMIHANKDCEGLERVQLDNYNDYLLDPLDEDVDVTMDRESSSNIKVDNVDDI
jgi:hypothetical protein